MGPAGSTPPRHTHMAKGRTRKSSTAANVGFEAQFWLMADVSLGLMDAAEYKHVTLGGNTLTSAHSIRGS